MRFIPPKSERVASIMDSAHFNGPFYYYYFKQNKNYDFISYHFKDRRAEKVSLPKAIGSIGRSCIICSSCFDRETKVEFSSSILRT